MDALNIYSGTLRLVGGCTWVVKSLSFGESAGMQFVVPEPGSMVLLASGLAAFLLRRSGWPKAFFL